MAAGPDDAAPAVTPSVAPTLLALAGVRDGDTVLALYGGGLLLAAAAAAAAGPAGRVCAVDRGRAAAAPGVCLVRAEPWRLPFAAGSVGKVLCGPVPEDPAALQPAIAEWARVLAPGGRVALAAWRAAGAPSPDAADLADLLAAAGLRPVPGAGEDLVTLTFARPVAAGPPAVPGRVRYATAVRH